MNIQNSEIFDLKKAILFATNNSPEFDSLKRQLIVSDLEQHTAKAKLLPSLDISATHGIQDSSPRTSQTPWGSELNLGLTDSLYDNGVGRTNHQIAILAKKQAEVIFENQKNSISLSIVSQYLLYSLNVKLLEIQEKQFKFVNKQYDSISKYYYQGIKTQRDFLRFKTQVNRGQIDLLNAKNTVLKSKEELERLIGITLRTNAEIIFTPISLDGEKNEIENTNINIENHLQLKSAQIQKEINQMSSDLVARKNLPELYVSTGVNYGSSKYLGAGQSFSDNAQLGWNALLTLKYNFFDWGIRSNDKEVANQKNIIQSNELDTKILILKSTLNQLKINTEQVRQNYALAKELLSLEKNNIEFIEREYRNGKIQYLDLVTGLNNFSDAQIKYYSATSDLQTARYTMLYHQGKLYEDLLK